MNSIKKESRNKLGGFQLEMLISIKWYTAYEFEGDVDSVHSLWKRDTNRRQKLRGTGGS
jgi:hypothetical protein